MFLPGDNVRRYLAGPPGPPGPIGPPGYPGAPGTSSVDEIAARVLSYVQSKTDLPICLPNYLSVCLSACGVVRDGCDVI